MAHRGRNFKVRRRSADYKVSFDDNLLLSDGCRATCMGRELVLSV